LQPPKELAITNFQDLMANISSTGLQFYQKLREWCILSLFFDLNLQFFKKENWLDKFFCAFILL